MMVEIWWNTAEYGELRSGQGDERCTIGSPHLFLREGARLADLAVDHVGRELHEPHQPGHGGCTVRCSVRRSEERRIISEKSREGGGGCVGRTRVSMRARLYKYERASMDHACVAFYQRASYRPSRVAAPRPAGRCSRWPRSRSRWSEAKGSKGQRRAAKVWVKYAEQVDKHGALGGSMYW